MKHALAALCLFAFASPAMAAKSPKLVITYTANGKADDCKISEKEIKKIVDEKSDKGLCTKISAVSPAKQELTPENLAKLIALDKVRQGKLSLAFTGTDGAALVKTVSAWVDFLARQNQTGSWETALVSSENNVATIQLANSSGEAIELQVILGFEIPKDKE